MVCQRAVTLSAIPHGRNEVDSRSGYGGIDIIWLVDTTFAQAYTVVAVVEQFVRQRVVKIPGLDVARQST